MMQDKFLTISISLLLILSAIGTNAEKEQPQREQRAATSDTKKLWPNAIIYYFFDSSISPRLRGEIQDAMNEWQDETCLLFVPRNQEEDYVVFYSRPNSEYCTCDSVGKRGGEQVIELGYSCQSKGELLHTLGHVIGLWNEQARPDRDRYVQILSENIERGQEANFEKRGDFTIDYQGGEYDFGSIMHLSATAYSKNGSPTTRVLSTDNANEAVNNLGQRLKLSDGDKKQVNTLYSCPMRTVPPGKLKVKIVRAKSLMRSANPRVEVTAVDSNGGEEVLGTTRKIQGEDDVRNPDWEEYLEFPVQDPMDWQFFRIRILDQHDSLLGMPKTVHIEPGEYKVYNHCITANQNCFEFMEYGYEYIVDEDECDPDNCVHGDCDDLFVDYMCICPRGYDGKNCEIDVSGDSCNPEDRPPPCDPNNSVLCEDGFFDFTCECRPGFVGKDCSIDACASQPCVNSRPCIPESSERGFSCACGFSYYGDFCEHNRCNPNPCGNGGSCSLNGNIAKGYTCSCTSVWDPAHDCHQHEARCFSVFIRRAYGLPDMDPIFNTGDPYAILWLHDINGGSVRGITPTRDGTNNPHWNYGFNIGCEHGERVWTKFRYQVWDEDDGFFTGNDDFIEGGERYLQDIHSFPACNLRIGRIELDVYYYNRGGPGGYGTC